MNDLDLFSDVSNPLDSIEEIMAGREWCFERPNADELVVQVAGTHTEYRMAFLWQEEYSAMQFFCEFDLEIPAERHDATSRILRGINETLWLGHFDVPADSRMPYFRHTTLFRGMTHTSGADHIADLMEIALAECEKYYNIFRMLSGASSMDESLMALALADAGGRA